MRLLNNALAREGFEAFYGEDKHCYLRHIGTNTVSVLAKNPHRPLTAAEMQRRAALAAFLDTCSEDALIEQVLLPLFRQVGFQRITAAGHRDKALKNGKDIWMRYTLPTQHFLYRYTFIVAGGEITKAAHKWLGNALDAAKRSQIIFMDRDDILNQFVVTNLPLPVGVLPGAMPSGGTAEAPF